MLLWLWPLLAVVLVLLPWQQTASGYGRVIARDAAARNQQVDSPVKGRIASWKVREGQFVKAGDTLVEVVDNDPSYTMRLEAKREATRSELASVDVQIASYEAKLAAEEATLDLVDAEYAAKLAELRRKLVAAEAEAAAEAVHAARVDTLALEGLASQRDAELMRMKQQATAAKVQAQEAEIAATQQARQKAHRGVQAKVAAARAQVEAAKAKRAQAERKLLDAQTAVARQGAQVVRAPRDGRVLALYGAPEGGQVKTGDPLLVLVPDLIDQAVELKVDGLDMPFVTEGDEVRLVFEGWPALQFVGLPGAEHGTFEGRVAFIDASSDGSGGFRVVVVPGERDPWPPIDTLRPGVRAKGWVLLGGVPLGYELWRQMNGFPPLPSVEKGEKPLLPTQKKPRSPVGLQ
jgi:multidrug resistance efflux pump